MKQRCFVAWQPVLTDHQAFTLQALSRCSGRPVISHVARFQDPIRQAQGWTDTQVQSIERRLLPAKQTPRQIWHLLSEHRHDTHLFGSPFEERRLMLILFIAAMLGLEVYLISEPYSQGTDGYLGDSGSWLTRVKSLLRPLAYRCYGLVLKHRIQGVFTISTLASAQYRRIGIPEAKLFPFGYFIPRTEPIAQAHAPTAGRPLKLVFVGALIRRKGLDLLLEAVARLTADGYAVSLDVYGPGGPGAYVFDNLHSRLRGPIAFGLAQPIIAGHDLLVLPSRHDGWGVVVNEALCVSVPVVCSDQVGARALVERFGAGAVFESGNAASLAALIKDLLLDNRRLATMRTAAGVAADAIQPEVAAQYLLAVVNAAPAGRTAIESPWYLRPGVVHE
jgi:glycosyltransferase involved in cell wall biosynthesis